MLKGKKKKQTKKVTFSFINCVNFFHFRVIKKIEQLFTIDMKYFTNATKITFSLIYQSVDWLSLSFMWKMRHRHWSHGQNRFWGPVVSWGHRMVLCSLIQVHLWSFNMIYPNHSFSSARWVLHAENKLIDQILASTWTKSITSHILWWLPKLRVDPK